MPGEVSVTALLRESLINPRTAAARLFAMNPTNSVRWMGLALVTAVGVILSALALAQVPEGAVVPGAALFANPLRAASVMLAMLVVVAWAMQLFGNLFGGTGTFRDALLVTVWLQFTLLWFQVGQLLLLMTIPALASVTGMLLIVVLLWMTTHFVAELHGFTSALRVLAGIIAGAFLTVVALSLVIVMLGFTPPVVP